MAQGQTDTKLEDKDSDVTKMCKKNITNTKIPTYQDLFSLQDVFLGQLGGRVSCVHRVADQIRLPWHYTSTKVIAAIVTDLEISTWTHSTHFIVSLLKKKKEKCETNKWGHCIRWSRICSKELLW